MSLTSDKPGGPPPLYDELLDRHRARNRNSFRVRWHGTNVPRGISVDGVPLVACQNGMIMGKSQSIPGEYDQIAVYTRTLEDGGENHDEFEMIIATEGIVTGTDQMIVEQLRAGLPVQPPTNY